MKGARADAHQRSVIDGVLGEAERLGASRRVMVAAIMAITQESTARSLAHGDTAGPDSRGPFQQRSPWGPESQRRDPAGATRLFLTVDKGPGVQGWKVVHGGLKNAPGDLSRAINAVQRSRYPDAYAQWQAEAERTVDTWLGDDSRGEGGAASRRYEFTRGERGGQRESSWAATGRLAEEVGWLRWAAGNVFHFVSEQELRQAAPAVRITGDEPWLLAMPAWEWGTARPVTELTLRVLSERWGVMPGGVVLMATGGPEDGRWIVSGVAGPRLDSPEVEVTLRRPTMRRPEPTAEESADGDVVGGAAGGAQSAILDAARAVHAQGRAYLLGGGHGVPLTSIDDDAPLDCSSSTSLVLKAAGMFPGDRAIVSGAFASSWGAAGKGPSFTVWANATHVWIELHGSPGGWARFDTSPHGDGGSGPRLRRTARSTAGFTPRHWPGDR
ncbi:hypothetical protein [Miltoncostaea marina]|uniref:hypothetical protein n=1 Tax=Miltoncostaea marina TaxID=2843215 RepID=UPI001C3E4FCB|nr:hypothetical protein [Miltoncostaea marina]